MMRVALVRKPKHKTAPSQRMVWLQRCLDRHTRAFGSPCSGRWALHDAMWGQESRFGVSREAHVRIVWTKTGQNHERFT